MSLAEDTTFIRTRGRAAGSLPTVLGVRPLELDEVSAHGAREAGIKASPLRRLSSRHRHLAKLLASGMAPSQAAHIVGLTVSRVSILKDDPSFQDLLAFYGQAVEATFLPFVEKMAGLAEDTVDELQKRLEDDPDSFESDELLRIAQTFADRTGHAPKRVEERNINLNFGDRLEQARRTARQAVESAVIEDAELVEEEAA